MGIRRLWGLQKVPKGKNEWNQYRPRKRTVEMYDEEMERTGSLWVYIPMLDNVFILKMYGMQVFYFLRHIITYGLSIFF